MKIKYESTVKTLSELKTSYRTLQEQATKQASDAAIAMETFKKLAAQQLKSEKDERKQDKKMHDEQVATMKKTQKTKDAKAKVIEHAEDEAERKRAEEDAKRYAELKKRSAAQKKKATEDARAEKILHDKELKAEKDGRQEDVNKYRQQLLDMVKKHKDQAAFDKIIEDAEDESERLRASADAKRYADLQKRSETQRQRSEADAQAQRILNDKQLKAEKEGRQSDAARYKQEAADLAKRHADQAAKDKITEDAEDEAERKRAAEDAKRYDNLINKSITEARTAATEKANLAQ